MADDAMVVVGGTLLPAGLVYLKEDGLISVYGSHLMWGEVSKIGRPKLKFRPRLGAPLFVSMVLLYFGTRYLHAPLLRLGPICFAVGVVLALRWRYGIKLKGSRDARFAVVETSYQAAAALRVAHLCALEERKRADAIPSVWERTPSPQPNEHFFSSRFFGGKTP